MRRVSALPADQQPEAASQPTHLEAAGQRVDGQGIPARKHLQHASQEALWEEEAGQPEAGRRAVLQPGAQEGNAGLVVLQP
jgi:hypothetical protein